MKWKDCINERIVSMKGLYQWKDCINERIVSMKGLDSIKGWEVNILGESKKIWFAAPGAKLL